MYNISPIWIICTLEKEEYQLFEEKINRQFEAFCENEFGILYHSTNQRWWKVVNIKRNSEQTIINHIDAAGHPIDLPAVKDTSGTFDLSKAIIVFYGDINLDRSFSECFGYIEELKKSTFLPGITNVFYYGICIFKNKDKSQIADKLKEIENLAKQKVCFDAILFQSDVNKSTYNNIGYDNLDPENNTVGNYAGLFDQSVQTLFHIALSRNHLRQSAYTQKKIIHTGGAYTLTFEPDAFKQEIANGIAANMFDLFCHEKTNKAWCNEQEALNHLNSSDVSVNYSWKKIYTFLTQNYKEEYNIESVYLAPPISPWNLFSHWLIPKYFRKYLRNLAENIREGAHFFGFKTSERYTEHLSKQFTELLLDDSDYACEKISIALKSVWANNNDLSHPGGMQHIRLLLDKIYCFIAEQLNFITAIKEEQAPKNTNFPLIADYPLKDIPKRFYSYYRDFILNGEPEADNPEDKDKLYEERKLKELIKILKLHPVPLSLFTRAVLTGILAPLVFWAGLLFVNNYFVDTRFLEEGNGMIWLFAGIFIIFILGSFYKYWIKILRKIGSILKEYLAWYLFKLQKKLFKDVLGKQEKYYNALLDECKRVKINIEGYQPDTKEEPDDKPEIEEEPIEGFLHSVFLSKSEADKRMEFVKPLLPVINTKFEHTMFQSDILGKFDAAINILKDDIIKISIRVNKKDYEQYQLSDDKLLATFLNDLLKENMSLVEFLFEKVLKHRISNEDHTEYWEKVRKDLCELLRDLILARIELLNGSGIEELVFSGTTSGANNFNVVNGKRDTTDLIKSRFYPSVMLSVLNPHRETSYVIPQHALYDQVRWANVFSNGQHTADTIFRKSIVSIFQTFTLESTEYIDLK